MNHNKFRVLLLIYMVFILSLSSLPGESIPKSWLLSFDKLIHLIEYFILGILLMNSMKSISTKMLIVVIPAGIFFGMMDEYLQSFISGRFSSGWDVLADTIGVIIGSLLVIGNRKND
ncbi:MAG: VanZ family protein [Candidatus Marinimicrobia bacterium]|nr:VanZ family protein [Candidatus Neomarinimicrobiota bacterium]MBT7423446.1 VanZ family protein [Candidatus Neomarinimicrobiota bacterium]MBT7524620.1 VanZ family protein [Candidatus Neomarinimicrobiota bacterium]